MKCPHCNIPLLMTDRQGVEIDYCSQCRGVWLDKGELDKIIDLSVNDRAYGSRAHARQQAEYHQPHRYDSHHGKHHPDYNYRYHKKPYYKKKKTVLGEIFDIFD